MFDEVNNLPTKHHATINAPLSFLPGNEYGHERLTCFTKYMTLSVLETNQLEKS